MAKTSKSKKSSKAKTARAAKAAKNARSAKSSNGYTQNSGYYGRFSGPAAELKFFDTDMQFNVDLTPEVPATGQLNLIPQGVTESTRVGRKACLKSIQIDGSIVYSVPASVGGTIISISLVQDTQCNGAAAAATDVYNFNGTNMVQGTLRNVANSERFRVLKKWDISMNVGAGIVNAFGEIVRKWKYYTRCDIPIEFSSTTGALTEIRSNNLFLVAGSLNADDAVVVNGLCRVRFSDN